MVLVETKKKGRESRSAKSILAMIAGKKTINAFFGAING